MFDFSGKVVLVTGGAEKAGKYFAECYARGGADLVITHYRIPEKAEETRKEIEAMGRRCLAVEADNGSIPDLQMLVRTIEKEYGRLDVILHNASNFNCGPIEEVSESMWDSSMNLILKGPFFLCQAAAPLMLKHGGGKMVAIIGNSYYENWPDYIPHSIAKIGLAKLMQMLAVAFSPNIQCNAVCPASFLSSGLGDAIMKGKGEALDPASGTIEVSGIRIHRGCKEEVAEMLMFLSSCSSYVNGAVIPIDGGKNLI